MQLSDYQRDILIRTILGEARGEGDIGMAAVAHNIRNRALSGQFPDDPAKVALQPKQYSVWNEGAGGGKTNFDKNSDLYKRAGALVDGVFGGTIPDMTGGALYYHTPSVNPSWASAVNKHGTSQIGNHIFYHGRPVPPGELPQVASALDVTPPQPAIPVTASPDLAALRNSPSQQPDMRAALDVLRSAQMGTPDMAPINGLFSQPAAPRAPITSNDLIFDSGIADTIAGTQAMQAGQGDLASALERMLRPVQPRSSSELAAIYADGGPTRPPVAAPRLASPAQVAAAGAGSPWGAADGPALRPKLPGTQTTPRTVPPMPIGVAQSYAGQERQPAKTPTPRQQVSPQRLAAAQTGSSFTSADGPALSGAKIPANRQALEQEIMQALGETVATIPTVSAPQPATMSDSLAVRRAPGQTVATIPTTRQTPGQSGFAGQESTRTATLPKIGPTGGPPLNTAPKPSEQSIDIAVRRSPGVTVATVPTVQTSGVGQPPATKVVQSVPVNPTQKTAQGVPAGMKVNPLPRDVAERQQAGVRAAGALRWSDNAKTAVASPAKANPTGYGSGQVKTDNTRLAGEVYPVDPELAIKTAAVPALPGGAVPMPTKVVAPQTPTRLAVTTPPNTAPIPAKRSTSVGTQLAVTPPVTRTVPRPRPRPVVAAQQPLRIVVSGGNPMSIAGPSGGGSSAPQISASGAAFLQRVHSGNESGYTSLGNGAFADSSGGIYYDRHIK